MRQHHITAVTAWTAVFVFSAITQSAEPIDIGSRRELFVDDYLIESLDRCAS